MASVVYEGSVPAVCRELGVETGDGDLVEPGRVYDVTYDLAERLVASGAGWRHAGFVEPPEVDVEATVEVEATDDDEGEE